MPVIHPNICSWVVLVDAFTSSALTVTTAGLPFDFVQAPLAGALSGFFFKSTKDAFYYDGSTLFKVTDADYPATTVRGAVCLDGTFYVMTPAGQIYGSDLNAPTSWTALNFISAQIEPDGGVQLSRMLNLIVAFGQTSIEFFYDAGNPAPGSPLSPYSSAALSLGCAVAESVATANNQIIFMGVSKQKGRGIYRLVGTAPELLSTPSVERVINADSLAGVSSFCVKISGHDFYVLTLQASSITLACDLATGDWKEWTSSILGSAGAVTLTYSAATGLATGSRTAHGLTDADPVIIAGASDAAYLGAYNIRVIDANTFTYTPVSTPTHSPDVGSPTVQGYNVGIFIGKFYTGFGNTDLIQDSTGGIYTMETELYQDNGAPIDVRIRTGLVDGGVDAQKSFGRLEVIGDQASTTLFARYTGDDYQTYSYYRPVSLAGQRAMLTRLGRNRRRAFELRHTDNTALRLEALELTIEKGSN